MPGSEQPPKGWPGWPGGKKFAFVLTHDVESATGLNRVRQLAEMEMAFGFRSCFNFVPEGDYRVTKELRDWLKENGFEVGVHDIHHDGKLFRSQRHFAERAPLINHYLKEWDAFGFRSGFMISRLSWLHELNIPYDMSTFDTDPFEPQPEGVNTIFPFWVPRRSELGSQKSGADSINHQHSTINHFHSLNSQPTTLKERRSGYVELPYTLSQDSTLFLLFRDTTINIWKRKLAWIAMNHGMALVNVHPDYIQFEDAAASKYTYSVRFLTQLLHYVRSKYGDSVWNPIPGDVAALVAQREFSDLRELDGALSRSAVSVEEPTTPAVHTQNSPGQNAFARI